ncbi:MAG: L-2-amino-thiazoline-4-carboxylic acid hydrolase [Tepidisphaeraceae bacterium]
MKKVTTPLLLHMLGKELPFPRLFLLRCKFALGRFKASIDKRFPAELIELAALPAWVYINLKRKLGPRRAFEIMRVALLTGGTAAQNLQFDTVHKERNFSNFPELEIENNRTGLVRWNTMEVVERSARRFEIKITRCMFHEFAISVGIPELTPVVCQIDNAMFNSYLPDEMTFDRGPLGGRIADGKRECNFVWELRRRPDPPIEGRNV